MMDELSSYLEEEASKRNEEVTNNFSSSLSSSSSLHQSNPDQEKIQRQANMHKERGKKRETFQKALRSQFFEREKGIYFDKGITESILNFDTNLEDTKKQNELFEFGKRCYDKFWNDIDAELNGRIYFVPMIVRYIR